MSVYYDAVSQALTLRDVLIMTLLHLLVFFVVDLLIGTAKNRKNAVKIFAVLLYVALLIFFTVKWIIVGSAFYSLGFFMTLLSFVYVLAKVFIDDENPEKTPKYLSVASFAGYLVIAVIVTFIILLIISEGEILDGLGEGLFEGIAELFCSVFDNSNKKTKL